MDISILKGKTLTSIENCEPYSGEIIFTCSDGSRYRMYHHQECYETVRVEDICGDIDCLIGSPIIMAEETTNEGRKNLSIHNTWTYYKLGTINGYVTIRWYGESNGYYSESVNFDQISPPCVIYENQFVHHHFDLRGKKRYE